MVSTQLQTVRERLPKNSIGEAICQFMDYLSVEAGLAENTILGYGRDLLDFIKYLKVQGGSKLEHVTPNIVYGYLQTLSKTKKSESL